MKLGLKKVLLECGPSGDEGTPGKLYVDKLVFHTGELAWRDNKQRISCIPLGVYEVVWKWSPRFKRKMFLVQRVEGRWGIRFHSANFFGRKDKKKRCQLLGCITLGLKKGKLYGQMAVLQSKPAIKKFEKHMNGRSFRLTIRNKETS